LLVPDKGDPPPFERVYQPDPQIYRALGTPETIVYGTRLIGRGESSAIERSFRRV
jgi:hypothetical protein